MRGTLPSVSQSLIFSGSVPRNAIRTISFRIARNAWVSSREPGAQWTRVVLDLQEPPFSLSRRLNRTRLRISELRRERASQRVLERKCLAIGLKRKCHKLPPHTRESSSTKNLCHLIRRSFRGSIPERPQPEDSRQSFTSNLYSHCHCNINQCSRTSTAIPSRIRGIFTSAEPDMNATNSKTASSFQTGKCRFNPFIR